MSDNKGDLVQASPTSAIQPANLMPWSVPALHESAKIFTTINYVTQEGKGKLFDMVQDDGENANDWLNKPFGIKSITIHPATKINHETGEVIPLARILIETHTANVIKCTSLGVLTSIGMMKDCGWEPFGTVKQQFVLKSIPLDNGRHMYKLVRYSPPAKGKEA